MIITGGAPANLASLIMLGSDGFKMLLLYQHTPACSKMALG